MTAFHIVTPLKWANRTWFHREEMKLRMAGWPKCELYQAIRDHKIKPVFPDERWYTGPCAVILWDQGLFREQVIWDRLFQSKRRVYNIGKVRRKAIRNHLIDKIKRTKKIAQ